MRISWAPVVALLLVFCGGCFGSGTKDCKYWVGQLSKGKNLRSAIINIGDQKCNSGASIMAKRFPDSLYRREILTSAKAIGQSPHTIEIVTSALPDKEVGPLAIRMAMDWNVSGIKDALGKMVKSQRNASTRLQALEALVELSSAQAVLDTLIWVVGQEPTLQGVDTNAYAADQLQTIEWTKQDPEVAERAAQNLVKALFLKDQSGNAAQINARMALRAIGTPAMEPLLSAFKGTNPDLNEFAEIRGMPKWRYTQGHELVEMLWDVGDRRASPALMEAIGIALDPPPPDVARLPEDQRTEWKHANNNRLATTALTVGALVNDDAIKHAVSLLGRRNPPPDASQFINAGLGLALMGTPASRAALWQLFDGGIDTVPKKRKRIDKLKIMVKSAHGKQKKAWMKEHDGLIDDVSVIHDRRANFVTNLAVGLAPNEAARFKSDVLEAEKGALKQSANQPLPRAYYSVVRDCGQSISCYIKLLKQFEGKLDSIPKAIGAVRDELRAASKVAKAEAKPFNDKIRAKNKAVEVVTKSVLNLKDEIEKSQKKKKKDGKKVREQIKQFNAQLDERTALITARNAVYDERDAIYKKLTPIKEKLQNQQLNLYKLEKAVLILGSLPGGRKALPMLATMFYEAKPPYYQQFRQWALITMEHLAGGDDAKVLEELLKKESNDGAKIDYWTLRLQSLLQRIKRS